MNLVILQIAFLRGLFAGFALAAPMGPVAMLCVRRTLVRGRVQAFIIGLEAAVADMIFGAVAGLGLTVVDVFVNNHQTSIGLVGATIVLFTGIATFRAPISVSGNGETVSRSLPREIVAAFSMAITNPATMGAAAGLFAAFKPVNAHLHPAGAAWLVIGVFGGSALWWFLLVSLVGTMREGFLRHGLARLNRISGTVITLCGAAVLVVVIAKAFRHPS